MIASLYSSAIRGVEGYIVRVEVDVSNGLPGCNIVGLPDPAVRESVERVRSAIRNSGFDYPARRITVNLAPADIRKQGPGFDLAIAVGILAASNQVSLGEGVGEYAWIGGLSLDGRIAGVRGVLAGTIAAGEAGIRGVVVPPANAAEARIVRGPSVMSAPSLGELILAIRRGERGQRDDESPEPNLGREAGERRRLEVDLADVAGQECAKRALEIVATGGHNLLLVGPPGSGKTMLAKRLGGIMPALSDAEALEVTRIYSVCGFLPPGGGLIRERPFRAPHHTVSSAALVGGGVAEPRPGEVTLAHRGVLFLDEATEFRRDALEALRQPLEEGVARIARSGGAVAFPAAFTLVLAANPCPCGFLGDGRRECTCPPGAVTRYRGRLSGPLLDRVDLQVEISRPRYGEIGATAGRAAESQAAFERVMAGRRFAEGRLKSMGLSSNAEMGRAHVAGLTLDSGCSGFLSRVFERMGLSVRAHDRILKVARTIADLDESDVVQVRHLAEAVQYRALDRVGAPG